MLIMVCIQVTPKGDLVLCKVADAEEKTTGGIMLPTSAQRRPTSGETAALRLIGQSTTFELDTTSEMLKPASHFSVYGLAGDIVAVGDGKVGSQQQEFHLKVGETVLYSKFGIGVTDIMIDGQEHCLIKEDDCIGVLPRSGGTANDIPELKPNADRVLLKVQ